MHKSVHGGLVQKGQGCNFWNALWLAHDILVPHAHLRCHLDHSWVPAWQRGSHRGESSFRFSNSGWCLSAPQPSGWEIANSWSSVMKATSQIPAAAAAQWHIGRWPYLSLSSTAKSAAESADKSKSSHGKWCLCQQWRQPGWVEMKNNQSQCGIRCSVGNRWREMREVPCHHGWTVCFEVTNKNVRPWTAVPLWRWQICI